jgi:hypothetical protein
MKRNHVTIRPIDRKNLAKEFELFKELYNTAWEKNWSFVPMTEKELDAMVKSLGQFFDADLAFFGYVDGEPVGFITGDREVMLDKGARPNEFTLAIDSPWGAVVFDTRGPTETDLEKCGS